MELEVRHLRTVAVIAETGSLTRAAVLLGLSQPALSVRLRRMEEEIGAPLFTRSPAGVELTAVGEYVLLRARSILAAMSELRSGAARFVERAKPVITVGGSAGSVLLGLAERMGAELPDADVRLTMEYSPLLLRDLLAAGRLDLVTTVDYPGFEMPSHQALHCEVLAEEPVFVAVPGSDPLAAQDEIALGDLADHNWAVSPPNGAGWPDCFHIACAQHGFTPEVPYTTPNADTVRTLVAAGRAVAPCQPVYFGSEDVVVRPLAGNPLWQRHVMLCPRDGTLAKRLPTLVDFARDAYWSFVREHSPHYDLLRAAR
ncbi:MULTISPECIES: LysR family transcriptional regulator [Actinokineospora]|uniref:Transcriptional regulator n=1 Tax=Actinokineospora fastidiosa TaxID=1816 RepID=A0A918GMJ9_9PSEU|nr:MULTISPECIES: LysR family transcriptional regulator [Actinokineospora]UVS78573.1 Hca operon transcriptional activator [Actinokineospora sp. UTMC 2448]GGS45418.1 transcriptional regulator [Actinokineospora fastidiosa]